MLIRSSLATRCNLRQIAVKPVLCRVGHRDYTRSLAIASRGRDAALGDKSVDLLDRARRPRSLSRKLEPRRVSRAISLHRSSNRCRFLELRVPEANDVEVRRRTVHEEVHANRRRVLVDGAEVAASHCAGGIDEGCDGSDGHGDGIGSSIGAGKVLGTGSLGDQDECQARGDSRERVGRLRDSGQVAR